MRDTSQRFIGGRSLKSLQKVRTRFKGQFYKGIKGQIITSSSGRLATLLEGVNNKFFKVNFKKYILYKNGCFKAVKLVKKVILVI